MELVETSEEEGAAAHEVVPEEAAGLVTSSRRSSRTTSQASIRSREASGRVSFRAVTGEDAGHLSRLAPSGRLSLPDRPLSLAPVLNPNRSKLVAVDDQVAADRVLRCP